MVENWEVPVFRGLQFHSLVSFIFRTNYFLPNQLTSFQCVEPSLSRVHKTESQVLYGDTRSPPKRALGYGRNTCSRRDLAVSPTPVTLQDEGWKTGVCPHRVLGSVVTKPTFTVFGVEFVRIQFFTQITECIDPRVPKGQSPFRSRSSGLR